MAKNEIPYYTKSSRYSASSGSVSTQISALSSGANGSKLLVLAPNITLQRSTTGNESSIEIRAYLFDGTTNHEIGRYYFITSAAEPRIDSNKNMLTVLNMPKDKNGNNYLNLEPGTTVKWMYLSGSAGGGGGGLASCQGMFCHMEDY